MVGSLRIGAAAVWICSLLSCSIVHYHTYIVSIMPHSNGRNELYVFRIQAGHYICACRSVDFEETTLRYFGDLDSIFCSRIYPRFVSLDRSMVLFCNDIDITVM